MSFHDDCTDRDFRDYMSPDQLARLERLQPCVPAPPTALRLAVERLAPPSANDATTPLARHHDPITQKD
jgi:hypothetical protein